MTQCTTVSRSFVSLDALQKGNSLREGEGGGGRGQFNCKDLECISLETRQANQVYVRTGEFYMFNI